MKSSVSCFTVLSNQKHMTKLKLVMFRHFENVDMLQGHKLLKKYYLTIFAKLVPEIS